MPKGSFVVFRDTENQRDIHFQLASEEAAPSEEELELRDEIDRANTILKVLFPADIARFEEYFRPLVTLAQAGLVGDSAQPKLARRALESFKADLVSREGPRLKNEYMLKLGIAALVLGTTSALIAVVLLAWLSPWASLAYFNLVWSGTMVGVWLSFGIRKTTYTFDDLHIPEKDFLNPYLRLVFTGLLAMILALLFATSAVELTIGAVRSSRITSDVEIALLIGALSGVGEQLLSTRITAQASQLLSFGTK